ncbi:hypothetical protein LIER_43308 [Lithospermum erythrorhizon]|uniref:Reverse transcriptase domain-containing protein n=1 Tax=Lithospermum erythrorhizon TaxID=34254 RepID=A0AAV3PTN8_LITER
MSSRLATILPYLISDFQAGFVKERLIEDNILLPQELIHYIDQPGYGGNVLLKLDMSKAFDMLSWKFLQTILTKFGFDANWIQRVMSCISNSWFSVLVNGEAAGFFKSSKGIRQGDPLSPGLFILAEDYLLRSLQKLMQEHPAMSYNTKCNLNIPCLAYADDCLIFYNGSKSSLSKISKLLDHYQSVSGQVLNTAKSTCIMSSKLTPDRNQQLHLFMEPQIPFLWWQNCSHPNVLSTLPLYYLQVIKMPEQIKTKIGKIFNKFLWGDHPWCSWEKLCAPFEEGGLNFRSLDGLYSASMMKAWYRLREGKSLWSKFMHIKYCRIRHPSVAKVREPQSRLLKNLTKFRDLIDKHIVWRIGKGGCDFWLM